LKRSAQISTKVKGLDQAFFPKGLRESRAIWSSSAEDEICLLTDKVIKPLADKLKIPQSRLHKKFNIKQNVSFISGELKSISCRRLETKSRSVRNDDFGFRRKAQVRSN